MNNREDAAILAGLRIIQRALASGLDPAILDIATDGGSFEALSAKEVDSLCERLDTPEPAPKAMPVVAIISKGGVIQEVVVDRGAHCALIDFDEVGAASSRAVPQGDGHVALASCDRVFPMVDAARASELLALTSPKAKAQSQGRAH